MQPGVFGANIVALLLIYAISLPIICIYTYRFYQHKAHRIMQHRDVLFVLSLNCLIVFGLITHRTLTILSNLHIMHYPVLIQQFFTGITIWGTLDLICIKSYLLYFQHQYHISIQNISWKKHINSTWIDWYLQNKNKWGKFSYLIRWIFIPFTLTVIIECIGKNVLGWLFMFIFHMVVGFVPILLVIVFTYRSGNFYDIYGIRKEIIFQSFSVLILGVIYFIAAFIINIVCPTWNMGSLPGYFVPTIAFSTVAISSVCYPLYLLRHQSIQPNGKNKPIHVLSAIKDSTMLSLFMQHSVREFNTENLLFIIECVQIKHAYQTAKNNVIKTSNKILFEYYHEHEQSPYLAIDLNGLVNRKPDEENKDVTEEYNDIITYLFCEDFVKVQIPSELPKSAALTKYPDDIRSQIAALYHKYVKDDANLEINLPFALKQKVTAVITANDSEMVEGDWFWVMDQSCFHIFTLLVGPFSRFKQTETFKRYVQSKKYQTAIKRVELIDFKNKPDIYQGSRYDEVVQRYTAQHSPFATESS